MLHEELAWPAVCSFCVLEQIKFFLLGSEIGKESEASNAASTPFLHATEELILHDSILLIRVHHMISFCVAGPC